MIKGVHHAGLTVRDLDRSIAFFHTAQSFTLVSRHKMAGHARLAALAGEAAEGGEVARLKGPTGFLELFCFGQATSHVTRNEVYQPGLRHICLQAADGEALFDSFVASGAIEHGRPISLATGNLYAYVRDPEGNILELEGLPHAAALSCPPWMGHIALVSPDLPRLTDFYVKLLGRPVHASGRFGPHPRYDHIAGLREVVFDGAWVRAGSSTLEMWHYHHPKTCDSAPAPMTEPGWTHFSLEVEDLMATHDRLMRDGITFCGSLQEDDCCLSLTGRDPDGTRFELIEIKPSHFSLSLDSVTVPNMQDQLDALHAAAQPA